MTDTTTSQIIRSMTTGVDYIYKVYGWLAQILTMTESHILDTKSDMKRKNNEIDLMLTA